MAATLRPHQHPIQIAGRTVALAAFLAGAFAGGRNLLLEPRTSPFDVVQWTGGLVVGLIFAAAALAALLGRPLLGGRDGSDRRYATAILLAVGAFAGWAAIVGAANGRWWPAIGCGAVLLAYAFDLWRAARRRATPPPA